ncbi:prepilin-type N-terminal cleavage/methylation domain-containing protein [Alteromonas sp. 5E99-2]|uniref:type IV pilin protein n=1 Tax=Alteromonas sp. 5E99-2 TaxID=2817683 RepID=UPI001A990333|nr:type IV pilin protein [Alteromonas sp. 5E99-2]MBO1255321.1 prepilin-type N-terminal cleavage/methylation domain-containing protein [Alteromonas sp. 5E99-2]
MEQVYYKRAFSLIELLISLAVGVILASIAIPSYQDFTVSARRKNAQTELLQLHLQQQAFFLQQQRFANANEISFPEPEYYFISMTTPSSTEFVIQANALGGQKQNELCDTLSIDQNLNREPKVCW